MKIIIPLIFFQLKLLLAFTQVDSISKDLLETLLRKQHTNGTLYYTDRLGNWSITRIKEATRGRRFVGQSSPEKHDTIYLSLNEKKYLDSAINKLKSYYWVDSFFHNSKRIPEDSMWARIKKQNKEFSRTEVRDTTKAALIKSVKNRVYNANTFQFSPPIYFRNKSICLIYILRLCGDLCGVEELTFYKLDNGSYKKWFLLSGRAF